MSALTMEVNWEGELSQTQCRRIRNRVAKRKSRQKQQESQSPSQQTSRDVSQTRPQLGDASKSFGQSFDSNCPHNASNLTNWSPSYRSSQFLPDEHITTSVTQQDIDAAMDELQPVLSNDSSMGFAAGWELLGQPDGSDVLVQAPQTMLDSPGGGAAGLQMPQLQDPMSIGGGSWSAYGVYDASGMGAPNGQGQNCETFLHRAIAKGRSEIVRVLLQNGADPNARGPDGLSPLHVAIREKQRPIIKTLLAFYGDIRAPDDAGMTPLDLAIDTNDEESVRTLVEGGALLHRSPAGE